MRCCTPVVLLAGLSCLWRPIYGHDGGGESFKNVSAPATSFPPSHPDGANDTTLHVDECHRRCERGIRPLCGSDEVTYENECNFECAKRRLHSSPAELKLRYRGVCCPPARLCAPYVRRVCDEEGVVYENECIFNHRQCVLQRELGGVALRMAWLTPSGDCPLNATKSLRQGGAGHDPNSTMPLPSKPMSIGHDGGECSFFCDKELQPLCDSQGRSHKNFCKFALTNCRLASRGLPVLQIEHAGECDGRAVDILSQKRVHSIDRLVLPSINPIRRLQPESARRRASPLSTRAKASSGATILKSSARRLPNEAMVALESGEEDVFETDASGSSAERPGLSAPKRTVTAVSVSSTPQPSTTIPTPLSTTSSGPQGPACSAALCDKSWSPVCDTRGVTHRNECLFHFHLCKVKSRATKEAAAGLKIAHVGPCDGATRGQQGGNLSASRPTSTTTTMSTSTVTDVPEPDCDEICGEEESGEEAMPVCDNTNRTHQSICLFAQWNCERLRVGREERVLVHLGQCYAISPLFDLKSEECPQKCSKQYKPVCDTRGVTHPNLCAFQKHNCHMRHTKGADGGGGAVARPGWLRSLRACGEEKDSRILKYLT